MNPDRIPTAYPLDPIERALLECKDCMVYEERIHDQYCRKLGLPPGSTIMTYPARSGTAIDFGLGKVPLWTDYVLCPVHEKMIKELEEATPEP